MIAVVLAMLLVAVGCGQKDGVADQAAGLSGLPAGAIIDPETGALINPETGALIDPETGEVLDPGTTGGTTPSGGDSATGGSDGAPGDPEGPSDPGAPTGGDTTGVTASDQDRHPRADHRRGSGPLPVLPEG